MRGCFTFMLFQKVSKKGMEKGMEKKLTGYPSIDKPHDRFYREKPVRDIQTEQTIYELVFYSNRNNMNHAAIEYLGKMWTFGELKEQVEKAATAFSCSGLKMGDTVLLGVSNCPEAVICLLALNKIGVVSKWFDVRAGEKDIEEYANGSNCRYLIAFDMLLQRVELILDKTCLEKVLIVSPADSLGRAARIAFGIKSKIEDTDYSLPKDKRYIRFWSFIKEYNNGTEVACVPFDRNRASIMIQSSGTTGKPKVIVHSDFSASSCVSKLAYSDLPLGDTRILLDLLPPWIAYALGEAILYSLTLGTKVILCPSFDAEAMMPYLGKFTISFAAPFHYRYLLEKFESLSKAKKKRFFAASEGFVSGGDKITTEENAAFERCFNAPLVNGYGNNEAWGALTVNPMLHNKYGSVGIPKYGETLISYDNETGEELPYGQVGEICALADTMFLYYEGNPEETAAVKKTHADGKTWLHTGDLGYIDEEGYVFLQGRLRRVIVRSAFKISAYTIEDKICEHTAVKECVAVEVKDDEEEHVPMAFVVLKNDVADNAEAVRKSIFEKCKSELKEYEIPKYFQLVSSLPYTQNGKYDFRLLEEQGNEYVSKAKHDMNALD